jgi:N-acetyl sugar amidotransferase
MMVLDKNDPNYRQCSISVMDNIADPDITFDENGICNYYYEYLAAEKENVVKGDSGLRKFQELITEIKSVGKNKKYDCITGVSGGVDSSYTVFLAKKWGLRPLLVHFDNGWNTETSVENIRKLVEYTGFDLYTLVVDWAEFSDLQRSYLKASVVDIEVPTDHAISGTLQKLAAKYNVKYILSGNNVSTEAILPKSWIFNKGDHTNLLNIHKKFGTVPIKTYPLYGVKEEYYYGQFKGIQTIKPLNFLDFKYEEAKNEIINSFGWKDYGGKHYESYFTKFYQAFILPEKFNIDKRKAHLSNLIFSGQITKNEALLILETPLYVNDQLKKNEIDFVLKKLGLSQIEFEELLKKPRIEHNEFGHKIPLLKRYPILKLLKPIKKLIVRS